MLGEGVAFTMADAAKSIIVITLKGCILKDILKDILCANYVELVLKSSIEKRVGRTLSRDGKSVVNDLPGRNGQEEVWSYA